MSVTWGKDHKGESGVKILLWLIVAYEGIVGVAELASGAASSSSTGAAGPLTTISQLPSIGNMVTSISLVAGGAVDLAIAGGVYYWGLHKRL